MKTTTKLSCILCLVFLLCNTYSFSKSTTVDIRTEVTEIKQKALEFKYLDYDSLLFYLDQAGVVAYQNSLPDELIRILFLQIEAELKHGDNTRALHLCDSAEIFIKKHKLDQFRIELLVNKGNVFLSTGLTSESLQLFFEALNKISEDHYYENTIDIYYYLAYNYYYLNEIELCQQYLDYSLSEAKKIDSDKDLFSSYLLYFSTYNSIDIKSSYLDSAEMIISQNPEMKYEKVALLNNQALLLKSAGRYKLSSKRYNDAMNIAKDNYFNDFLSTIYNNYSYLLMSENKLDSAKYYLRMALELSINSQNTEMEYEIYDSYSDYYDRLGDYENSLKYTRLFIDSEKEYRKQQHIQKSLFLSALFETEQKEKEILLKENDISRQRLYLISVLAILFLVIWIAVYLRQKLSLRKSELFILERSKSLEVANAMILGQDNERKRLAMDLHDGVSAGLGAIRIMIDSFFKNDKNYPKISGSLVKIHQDIRELSHRLLPPEIENMGMVQAIHNFISLVNKSDQFSASLQTNIKSRLPIKIENNIYFLIYELVNNAIKHSKGDTIIVQLFLYENQIMLSVEDNGGNFKLDKENTGMGYKNILTRVDFLNGIINIDSNNTDTHIMIEMPINDD